MKRNLVLIIAVFIGFIVLTVTGNVLIIGDKLGHLSRYAEAGFYAFIGVLFIVLVIWPMVKIHYAPAMPVLAVDPDESLQQLREMGADLRRNCSYIPESDKRKAHRRYLNDELRMYSHNHKELEALVEQELNRRIEGDKALGVIGINKRITEWAKTVFMVTAISQNSKLDSVAVAVLNYQLIGDLVQATGFRPTFSQMFKLYVKVLTTALVSYCVSEVFTDTDGVAPFDIGSAGDDAADIDVDVDADVTTADEGTFMHQLLDNLKSFKIPGLLVDSLAQGAANALLTLRIGYVTKAYITEGAPALSGMANKRRVKRQAMKSAISTLPGVVSQGCVSIGRSVSGAVADFMKD